MKRAMSMIETVIAIVVMGIAVSALPMILTQSQSNNALSLQQEAILATKSKVGYILGYEWDADSYDATAGVSRVLDTTASSNAHDAFDAIDANTTRRIGHVIADKRRRIREGFVTPNTETSGFDDIDDFNARSEIITISDVDDYIFDLNLSSSVTYVSDGRGSVNYNNADIAFNFGTTTITGNPTNIKMISVTTTGEGMNITLRAFASNIGESTLAKRIWQ